MTNREHDANFAARYESFEGDLPLSVLRRPAVRSGTQPRRAALLLHGWPGTHLDWKPVFERLALDPRFDAIDLLLPDLRGFGKSAHPAVLPDADAPYSEFLPAAHITDLGRLLDYAEVEHVVVAGYDLGANLAQGLAAREPERVKGLLLCDPVHPAARAQAARINLASELWYQQLHQFDWTPDLVAHDRDTLELYLRHFYTHWWGDGTVDEGHFQGVVDSYAKPGAFRASIGWYRARALGRAKETAAAAAAPRSAVPAQVLWGEADPVTPVVFSESLGESFADFELEPLAGVGHFVPLEVPQKVSAGFAALLARLRW